MKTAGQLLKEARLEKGLSVKEVSGQTKILPQYLKALENDDYVKLPSAISTRGFIKNYAEYLDLKSEEILAIFRRDFDEKKVRRSGSETPLGQSLAFNWTPRMTALLIVGFLALAFLVYLIWQYRSLLSAPYY